MKNKKGFTLIELLAVIVVLAVIALIAIPIITNVIDKAKQGALKDSAYGIMDAAEIYLAKNLKEGITDTLEFTCSDGKCISGEEEIDYKGDIDSGKVRIYSDNKIELCITDNNNAALKRVTDKEANVSTGTCNYGDLNYDVSELVSKDDFDKVVKELNDLKFLMNQTTLTEETLPKGLTAVIGGKLVEGTAEYGKLTRTLIATKSYGVASTTTYDIAAILPDYYKKLTSENFAVIITEQQGYTASTGNVRPVAAMTYDANTGVLTVPMLGGTVSGTFQCIVTAEIYAYYLEQ